MFKIGRKKLARHVACIGEMSEIHTALYSGKPQGRWSLGKPRRTCEDNIKKNVFQRNMVWTGFIWLRIDSSGRLL
jgi:hypothetical protein